MWNIGGLNKRKLKTDGNVRKNAFFYRGIILKVSKVISLISD